MAGVWRGTPQGWDSGGSSESHWGFLYLKLGFWVSGEASEGSVKTLEGQAGQTFFEISLSVSVSLSLSLSLSVSVSLSQEIEYTEQVLYH